VLEALRRGDPSLSLATETGLRKALELWPGHADLHRQLGSMLHGRREFEAAVVEHEEALRLQPDGCRAYLGFALADSGRTKEAREVWSAELARDPSCFEALRGMGNSYLGERLWEHALPLYESCLRVRPGHPAVTLNAVRLLTWRGRFGEAREILRDALRFDWVDPWNDPLKKALRGVDSAIEAESLLNRLLSDPTLLDTLPASRRYQLAGRCRNKRFFALEARLEILALEADPTITQAETEFRLRCAASSFAAGTGQGDDATLLSAEARCRLREQALLLLKEDLAACEARLAEGREPPTRVREHLRLWLEPDEGGLLAGSRDEARLQDLPEAERAAWKRLWQQFDELSARLRQ
jgi:hypothetical protein